MKGLKRWSMTDEKDLNVQPKNQNKPRTLRVLPTSVSINIVSLSIITVPPTDTVV